MKAWIALLLAAGPVLAQTGSESGPASESGSGSGTEQEQEQAQTQAQKTDAETLPVVAVASEPEAPPPSASGGTELETVTVTAERKVATLQQTPISIEAFSADKLQLRGIEGLSGIAAHVPNMTAEPFPIHNATLRIFIRGEGTSDVQLTQDPAVGVYIDGVYIARSLGLAIDTADLERIEVLRGPQGTLYGRNTTGGAINLVTRRPSTGGFTMAHQVSYGQRGHRLGKSSFNLPVTDDLAVKLAVLGHVNDGFVENTGPGGDFSDRNEKALRFDARWQPGEWTFDYDYDRTELRYYGGLFQAVLPPNTSHGLGDYFKAYAQTQTVYSDRRLPSLATSVPLLQSGSLTSGHAFSGETPLLGMRLKYIGAFRKLADDEYQDLGGGMGSPEYRLDTGAWDGPSVDQVNGGNPTPAFTPRVEHRQSSHELQLSGSLFDTVEFIAGGFVFEEKATENGHPIHHILNAIADPSQFPPAFGSAFAGLSSPRLVAYWDYDLGIHNTARAVFAQATWSPAWLDGRTHLTGGLRKSWDTRHAVKTFAQTIYIEGHTAAGSEGSNPVPSAATPGNDVFDNVHGDRSYSDLSPSAILRYDVLPTLNTYLSYTRAYKSGGFNVRDPQKDKNSGPASDNTNYGFGFAEGFRPEYVTSTELGMKSEWFERRLRFNVDVFDSHLTDMQTNFLIAGTISDTKSRNVGKARMRGLELETAFAALPGLVLTLNYAHLDAKVLEVLDINGNNQAKFYPFPSAPPDSGVAGIDWTFAQVFGMALRAYAGYNYIGKRDGVVIVEERRDMTRLDPVGLLNARLMATGLKMGDRGNVEFALWGKNLTDREYEVFAIDNTPQADRSILWGDPRAVGLDVTYRYN